MGSNYLYLCFLLFIILFQTHLGHFHAQIFSQEEEEVQKSQFPAGFFFGASTSSYQIEGAYLEDGKSFSNWDVFYHSPENDGGNGDIADDHYHRYLEDIEIMHSLGFNAYRFSISWARVLPRGRFGKVNPAGVSFYNKIIDTLLLKGIEPFVAIHHHDFPQELQERYGSWLSPQMQEDFLHFAETCFRSFGDRVKHWITINEPNLFTEKAYIMGQYPPAHCSEPFGNCSVGNSDVEPLIAMHNMLLAHAKAAKLYHERFQPEQGGDIGIIVSAFAFEPMTETEIDREAANRAFAFNVAWTFDPLIFGDYPPEMRQHLVNALPRFSPEEAKYVKGSIDFIGINHYSTRYAKDCLYTSCFNGADRAIRGFVETTAERNGVPIGDPTGMPPFFVVPSGMEKIVNYVKERYHNMPVYVTENGYATPKQNNPQVQDLLNDVKRIQFHKAYLASLARAIRKGADVRGYFVWTLMDNYEWTWGYNVRFGIYYVDRQTLERTPKLSATWYTRFLANNSSSTVTEGLMNRSKNVIFVENSVSVAKCSVN